MNHILSNSAVASRPGAVLKSAMLLAAVALLGGGCSLTAKHSAKEEVTASIPTDYRQRHPIAIKEGARTVDVFVGARRGGLNPTQRAEVAGMAEVWNREATGGLVIDIPTGTPNARAAADAEREIRSVLASSGVPPRAMVTRRYRPSDPSQLATIRIHYPRMVAQAGPCGLWPEDLGLTYDSQPSLNRPYWNLGCANQRNLAAMVAEPSDLAQPRSEGPISTARRTTVMEKYRLGASTATVYPTVNSAGIAEVAR
jgi:pilus assembly protein CpaD